MAIGTGLSEAVKESSRFAKKCGDFKLQVLVLVQVLSHTLIKSCHTFIDLLDPLVQLEVLLFHQAHLHQSCLITCLQGLVRLNQILQL